MVFSFENIGLNQPHLKQGEFFKENKFIFMAEGASQTPKIIEDYKREEGASEDDHKRKIDNIDQSDDNFDEEDSGKSLTANDFNKFSEQWKAAQDTIPQELKANESVQQAFELAQKEQANIEDLNKAFLLIGDAFQKAHKNFQEKAANDNSTAEEKAGEEVKPKTLHDFFDKQENPMKITSAMETFIATQVGDKFAKALKEQFPVIQKGSAREQALVTTLNILRENKNGITDETKAKTPWLENIAGDQIDEKEIPAIITNVELVVAGENEREAIKRNDEALEKAINENGLLQILSMFIDSEKIKEWLMADNKISGTLRTFAGVNISPEDLQAKNESDNMFQGLIENGNQSAKDIESKFTEKKSLDLNIPSQLQSFFQSPPLETFNKRLPEQHEQYRTGNLLHDISGRFGDNILNTENPFSNFKAPKDENLGSLTVEAKTPLDATGIAYFYESQINLELKNLVTSFKEGKDKESIINKAKSAATEGQRFPDHQQGLPDTIYTQVNGNKITFRWHKASLLKRTMDVINKREKNQKAGEQASAGKKTEEETN